MSHRLWDVLLPSNRWGYYVPEGADNSLDAANEEVHMVGKMYLEVESGSKTISAAGGGSIGWFAGASNTFNNAGTNLRIGIQDVSLTTGRPARGDGTFDVQADLVGGTDTINNQTWTTTAMESGSKTIAHGDRIAIAFTLTARGGADSVKVKTAKTIASIASSSNNMPQVSVAAPTFAAATVPIPIALITFDDGSLGWLDYSWITNTQGSGNLLVNAATSFDSGTTPDEYAMIFQLEDAVTIDALWCTVNGEVAGCDFELILYADPEGTPSALETITYDAELFAATNVVRLALETLPTRRKLAANTKYAVALRPTTANNISVYTYDVADASHWKAHSLGTNCYIGSRSNQTGAFSATTTKRFQAGVRLYSVDTVGPRIWQPSRRILTPRRVI